MSGFVDIHSHVLYGLDDGASAIDESLAMLELAAASGTVAIVATPHANSLYDFRPDRVVAQIAELQPRTRVRIHPGCDFHLSAGNVEDALAFPRKYTIGHGKYLLVEFPDMGLFHAADAVLRELLEAGMVPIISHPERNAFLRRHVDDLAQWVEEGCYLQATAASFTGLFGADARRSAEALLMQGLVHIVASDGHNTRHRTPVLQGAFATLCERWGEDAVGPLFRENPAAVVAGEVMPFEPAELSGRRRWYQFWRA